jgi:hypothetical protein
VPQATGLRLPHGKLFGLRALEIEKLAALLHDFICPDKNSRLGRQRVTYGESATNSF